MYQASVPVFVTMLNNLNALLEKAEVFAKQWKIEEGVLLNWRLAPDMFPFTRQVQIAADFAKGTTARLLAPKSPNIPMMKRATSLRKNLQARLH